MEGLTLNYNHAASGANFPSAFLRIEKATISEYCSHSLSAPLAINGRIKKIEISLNIFSTYQNFLDGKSPLFMTKNFAITEGEDGYETYFSEVLQLEKKFLDLCYSYLKSLPEFSNTSDVL